MTIELPATYRSLCQPQTFGDSKSERFAENFNYKWNGVVSFCAQIFRGLEGLPYGVFVSLHPDLDEWESIWVFSTKAFIHSSLASESSVISVYRPSVIRRVNFEYSSSPRKLDRVILYFDREEITLRAAGFYREYFEQVLSRLDWPALLSM